MMKHDRHTTRLSKHNYSTSATYAITIGAFKHYCLFGDIKNQEIIKNNVYETIQKYILELPKKFNCVNIPVFVIMPNHIHLIMEIKSNGLSEKDNLSKSSLHMQSYKINPTLGQIIAYMKYNITKEVNGRGEVSSPEYEGRLFLRGYYDHIIRNKEDLIKQTYYIKNNPKCWFYDEYFKKKKIGS